MVSNLLRCCTFLSFLCTVLFEVTLNITQSYSFAFSHDCPPVLEAPVAKNAALGELSLSCVFCSTFHKGIFMILLWRQ